MGKWQLWFWGILAAAGAAAGCLLGGSIPLALQRELFAAVRDTAAIVFAAVGIWLSLLYPALLRRFFEAPAATFSGGEARALVLPLLISGATASLTLLTPILATLITGHDYGIAEEATSLLRVTGGLLVVSTIATLFALALALAPGVTIGAEFKALAAREQLTERLRSKARVLTKRSQRTRAE